MGIFCVVLEICCVALTFKQQLIVLIRAASKEEMQLDIRRMERTRPCRQLNGIIARFCRVRSIQQKPVEVVEVNHVLSAWAHRYGHDSRSEWEISQCSWPKGRIVRSPTIEQGFYCVSRLIFYHFDNLSSVSLLDLLENQKTSPRDYRPRTYSLFSKVQLGQTLVHKL